MRLCEQFDGRETGQPDSPSEMKFSTYRGEWRLEWSSGAIYKNKKFLSLDFEVFFFPRTEINTGHYGNLLRLPLVFSSDNASRSGVKIKLLLISRSSLAVATLPMTRINMRGGGEKRANRCPAVFAQMAATKFNDFSRARERKRVRRLYSASPVGLRVSGRRIRLRERRAAALIIRRANNTRYVIPAIFIAEFRGVRDNLSYFIATAFRRAKNYRRINYKSREARKESVSSATSADLDRADKCTRRL